MFQTWKTESDNMNNILEAANAAAQKMTLHDDADVKYAAFKKRWTVIDQTAKDWIVKYESMVGVWKKQAETAEKVNNESWFLFTFWQSMQFR